MYNSYFGLAEPPFNITPDSRFLYLSEQHKAALASLLYGIRERKGFILLTGEIGSGKTTVCRALVNELKAENIKLALILNPGLSEIELLKAINDEFGIPSYYDTKKGLVDALNHFLLMENQKGQNVCLIIDEAQTLEPGLLEQIRMLSNLETEDSKLLQIVLIGQPELNDTMALPQLEQLNQRVTVRYHVTPLQERELSGYISHRLNVAEAKVAVTFTPGAIKQIYQATYGVPRRINVLCDRALLAAYANGTFKVDERIMSLAIKEVQGATSGAMPRAQKRTSRRPSFLPQVLMFGFAFLCLSGLIAASIALGVKLANVQAEIPQTQPVNSSPEIKPKPSPTVVAGPATPTPPPDWDALRKRMPNWQYEPKISLVRVNEPRFVMRAAQFSLLRAWGYSVNMRELAQANDEFLTQAALKTSQVRLLTVPLSSDFDQSVRLNVPLLVKTKDAPPNLSSHVVLLRAEGEALTVGDPIWGAKEWRTKDFKNHWSSAVALGIDHADLKALKKGDRTTKVRDLQSFLKSFLKSALDVQISGTYDVKTTEAIQKFQAYYGLPETGQLDDLTVILLNARMDAYGPKLNAAAQRG